MATGSKTFEPDRSRQRFEAFLASAPPPPPSPKQRRQADRPPKKTASFSVHADLHEKAKRQAEVEGKSFSEWLSGLVVDALERAADT